MLWEPIVTFIFIAICLAIFFIRFEKLSSYCKPIGVVVICHFIFYSFTAYYMFGLDRSNNMVFFHVLRPLQYSLICLFLNEVIQNKVVKKVILISVPFYIMSSLLLSFKIQGIKEYNSYAIILYNTLLSLWILLFLKDLYTNNKVKNLLAYGAFWISIGLLFYCVGTTFSEGLMNYLVKFHRKYALSFYYIGTILSLFLYGSVIIAFLVDKTENKNS